MPKNVYAYLTELLSILDEQGATAIEIFLLLTLLVSLFYFIFYTVPLLRATPSQTKLAAPPSRRGPELLLNEASQRKEISASSHVLGDSCLVGRGAEPFRPPCPPSSPTPLLLTLSFRPSSSPTPFSNLRPKLSRNGGDYSLETVVMLLSRNGGDVTVLLLSRNGGDVTLSEQW